MPPRENMAVPKDTTNSGQVTVNGLGHAKSEETSPSDKFSGRWFQVLGASFIWFNTLGIMTSFGEFQSYYTLVGLPRESPSNIAWIGSTQISVFLICGIISGPLFDIGYLRPLMISGSFLMVLGMMMTSLCKSLWQFVLAQGICFGLGSGLVFIPMVGVITQWFDQARRGIANGVASLGSGLGGVVFAIIFHRLQTTTGFGWAIRTIGFIVLGIQIVAVFLLKTRLPPTTARALTDFSSVHEPSFLILLAVAIVTYAAIFIPLVYLPSFGVDRGILDLNLGFYIVPIMNAATLPGRLIPAIIAQKYTGLINMILILHVLMGLIFFAWKRVDSRAGLIVFAIVSGFLTGAGLSMYTLTPIPFIRDPRAIGTRTGMASAFAGFGVLFGSPVAGVLLQKDPTYFRLQAFTGGLTFGSALLLLLARYIFTGKLFSKF